MSTTEPVRPPAIPLPAERPAGLAFLRRWWVALALLVGLLAVLGPFVWMLFASIKSQQELLQAPPTWWPESPTLANYERLFDRLNFPRYFWNSTFIAGMITLSNVVFCSLVGYALAKLRFFGRDKLFLLVLGTLLVPGSVTLVPLFVLMSKLGLVNSLWAVVLPAAAGAFGVFLMRQFMLAIPDDLLEAARVDGANEWQVFRRITFPLLMPIIMVVFVTLIINVMKIFDIVLILTPGGPRAQADVLALRMWEVSFGGVRNFGLGSAIAVFLFLLVIPPMIYNIRRFRLEGGR
jgi:multiple sugar transport system permease protein